MDTPINGRTRVLSFERRSEDAPAEKAEQHEDNDPATEGTVSRTIFRPFSPQAEQHADNINQPETTLLRPQDTYFLM